VQQGRLCVASGRQAQQGQQRCDAHLWAHHMSAVRPTAHPVGEPGNASAAAPPCDSQAQLDLPQACPAACPVTAATHSGHSLYGLISITVSQVHAARQRHSTSSLDVSGQYDSSAGCTHSMTPFSGAAVATIAAEAVAKGAAGPAWGSTDLPPPTTVAEGAAGGACVLRTHARQACPAQHNPKHSAASTQQAKTSICAEAACMQSAPSPQQQ
jgi:hypothetical protein